MANKADVRGFLAREIKVLRELGIRKDGDLLKHKGGPSGIMEEMLKEERQLRTAILKDLVKETVVLSPKFTLNAAANTLEVALANEDVAPGRVEEVITPEEQARVSPPDDIGRYIDLDDWRKRKGEAEDKALAGTLRLAEITHLATKEEIGAHFRPRLAFDMPPEVVTKIVEGCEKKGISNTELYDTLDMVEMVRRMEREHVNALIDAIFGRHGIKKSKPVEPKAEEVQPTPDAVVVETPSADIPADDLEVVSDLESTEWNSSEPAAPAQDDGDPEITSTPVPAGDTDIERALDDLEVGDSRPAGALAKLDRPTH